MTKHIVLISPHSAMIDCALFHNFDLTIIDKNNNINAYTNYVDVKNIKFFFYNYDDLAKSKSILISLHKICKIDAIISLTEKALRIASELSSELNLPTLPCEVINIIHDKNKMREFLKDKSGFDINYIKPKSIKELYSFAEKNGFPFILKPIDGYGSQGVKKITSYEQIKHVDFSENIMAEEFIHGDEYSIECFSFEGIHCVLAITKKMLINNNKDNNFTEMGHCVPADINSKNKAKICEYIRNFLNLIGIDNGPSHTEIKINKGKIRVIETHNRIGGDRISSLLKISTGIDIVELSILWPLKMCSPIIQDIPILCYAAICFFNPPCGKLLSITGIDTLKYSPHIIDIELSCKPGDIIVPIVDSFTRYGFVIATGKNEEEAVNNSIKAVKKIKFNTV